MTTTTTSASGASSTQQSANMSPKFVVNHQLFSTNQLTPNQLTAVPTNNQQQPSIATDSNGNFVISWFGYGTEDIAGVFAQRYSSQ